MILTTLTATAPHAIPMPENEKEEAFGIFRDCFTKTDTNKSYGEESP
jgi:hypothetical protein